MMRTSVLVLLTLLFSWVQLAYAESKEPAGYTQAVTRGVAEFEEKNFLEARAHFARAHALYPNARTMRALGMVEFELKNYLKSVDYLSDALAERERALDADKRAKTNELLDRAKSYIARLTLDLEPGTSVTVDGEATALEPGHELVLEVGDHKLEFHAKGRVGDKRSLAVQGGEQQTLRVRLMPLASSVPTLATTKPGAESEPEPERKRQVYKNPWLWTALGVVVAGAAAGTAIALTRDPGTQTNELYTGTGQGPALQAPKP